MTTRRMTQQSRRMLLAADIVRVRPAGSRPDSGYIIEMYREPETCAYVVSSAVGDMTYPTPTAAIRAVRRVRPDLLDVPVCAQPLASEYRA